MVATASVAAMTALGRPGAAEEPGARGGLAAATALVMVEDAGCPYCARFDRETRESYERSAEGRFAPLIRRRRASADIGFIKNVVYSPTFVLLVEGREVGRIVGYQGQELFWMEMAVLMRKAGFEPRASG